jgi:hypothetical protein
VAKLASKLLEEYEGARWPATRYQSDPGLFFREVLAIPEIMAHQLEITLAVRDHDKVAVSSGQKIGKTYLLACLILWYWCSFLDANVTIMMTTKGQMVDILWREIRKIINQVLQRTGVDLLADAKMAADPGGGIRAPDGRQIVGKSVQQIEALGGISGANMLFVVDEASFMSQRLFEALMGNRAGGGVKVICTSNPTRDHGPFFDIFHRLSLAQDPVHGWWTRIYSSRAVAEANLKAGLKIPGVATVEECDEVLALFGPEHPFYVVRREGRFLTNQQGKICPLHLIKEAQDRWVGASDWEGGLSIGVDPAGKSEGSDAWGFAVVRGDKCLHVSERHGLSKERGLEEACRLIEKYRQGEEIPRLLSDIDGPVGVEFQYMARELSERLLSQDRHRAFTYHGVKPSDYAKRARASYDRVRDELWGNVGEWLKTGAIPNEFKLEIELVAPSWIEVEVTRNGMRLSLIKATPKDVLRAPEMLGRSPNLADALGLAIWVPSQFRDEVAPEVKPWESRQAQPQSPRDLATRASGMGPYDLLSQAMGGFGRRND